MTLLDIIELYNINHDRELNDITSIYEDADIDIRLDKTTLAGVLLDECGALQALYNVTETFVTFSNLFFKKYKWNIEKLIDTMEFQYDPLKNKRLDWTETTDIDQNLVTDETTSENRTKDNTGTQTNTFEEDKSGTYSESVDGEYSEAKDDTTSLTKSGTKSEVDAYDSTETNTISAMNSSNYEPDTKRVTDTDDTKTTTTSESESGTSAETTEGTNGKDTSGSTTDHAESTAVRTDNLNEEINATNDRDKNEDLTWDETDTHTESGTVNITYQELIEKERKVAQFSIYGWIAKKYAKELFLLVY